MRQTINAAWLKVRLILPVALMYFVATRLTILLIELSPNTGSLWPASGIAFAAMILYGFRLWPVIFLGAFFAVVSPDTSLTAAALMAAGNTIEAVVGVWLALRLLDFVKSWIVRAM